MEVVTLQSVSKVFRHRPALFNWIGRERASETQALVDVSLGARKGEVLVLLGPNGSGKTTLLKLVSTFLLPDQGRILVAGADAVCQPDRVRSAVGFALTEARSFYPRLTGFENLDFFAALECVPRNQRTERVAWALEMAELSDAADMLAMKYSSGMFQRLGMARALLKKPSVLLLDEPTRSLDPAAARHVWRLVQRMAEAGTAVIVATHNFDEAIQLGSIVAILRSGRLIASRALSAGMSVDELRSFYFSQLDPSGEFAEPILGGVP